MDQHEAVMGDPHPDLGLRPEPGPLALLPTSDAVFVEAIERAGGTWHPLDADTRGLLWLSYSDPDDLDAVLTRHPDIGWVQLPWAGVDRFAHVIAKHGSGRVFTSAKGAFAQPVAEHALGMILALLRSFPRRARMTSWDEEILGTSLYRRNVTIVGAGGIARELIRLLEPFEARITVLRHSDIPVPGAQRTVTARQRGSALRTAQVLVIAAALTPATRHLIGQEELDELPRGAVLVNIARGPLVDPAALQRALASGHLAGAALDVTEPEPLPTGDPLWSAPNILITPHQADTPDMTRPLLARRVEQNVRAFLARSPLVGVVDSQLGY